MIHDVKKKRFSVKKLFKTESIKRVQRDYQAEYRYETAQSRSVILNIVSSFEKHGSVVNIINFCQAALLNKNKVF